MLNCWCITWTVGFKRLNADDVWLHYGAIYVGNPQNCFQASSAATKIMSNLPRFQASVVVTFPFSVMFHSGCVTSQGNKGILFRHVVWPCDLPYQFEIISRSGLSFLPITLYFGGNDKKEKDDLECQVFKQRVWMAFFYWLWWQNVQWFTCNETVAITKEYTEIIQKKTLKNLYSIA